MREPITYKDEKRAAGKFQYTAHDGYLRQFTKNRAGDPCAIIETHDGKFKTKSLNLIQKREEKND